MERRWNLIPKEILFKIFEYVKEEGPKTPTSLAKCALTCRLWRTPAQEVYFQSIHVFGKRDLIKARDILTKRENNYSLGLLVKEMYYAFDYETSQADVQLIDTLFPCLERTYYEQYSIKEPFQVYEEILTGGFKSLKEVPKFDKFDACESRNEEEITLLPKRLCLYQSRYKEIERNNQA
ncbi:unnamed protein product [Mucor hiemalis]